MYPPLQRRGLYEALSPEFCAWSRVLKIFIYCVQKIGTVHQTADSCTPSDPQAHSPAFVLPSQSFLSWLVINCMQHFMVLSDASEATLRHWGNIYILYRLYTFSREGHPFVLHVLNGETIFRPELNKLCTFLTVNQQTNKYCFQKQQQPNHAWGSVWLFYDLQWTYARQQWVWSCSVLQQS